MLLLAALLCCTDPATDSGEGGDTGDFEPDPEWFDQPWVAVHTFPADAGLSWELDDEFVLDGFTVPALLVAGDGTFRMFTTQMENHGQVTMLRSDDGETWGDDPVSVLTADDFDGGCGERLLDSAVVYLDESSFRLIVEGTIEEFGFERVFCSATSNDGDTWTAEEGLRWEGTENEFGTISVPEVIRGRDGRWLLYYLGDMGGTGGKDAGDSVRVAVSDDGFSFASLAADNVIMSHDTDPFPVFLDDGRIRLFHTHPVMDGRIGYSDSDDGVTFESSADLDGLDGLRTADELWLDPVAMRLPDGRMVMYFTRMRESGGTIEVAAIGRAWAVDG